MVGYCWDVGFIDRRRTAFFKVCFCFHSVSWMVLGIGVGKWLFVLSFEWCFLRLFDWGFRG